MREFVNHIHFVGVGGIGMSGIAEVLLDLGYRVSGSDLHKTDSTRRLCEAGAELFYGHDQAHIRGADVVVYSSAVNQNNPELIVAAENKIPVVPRAEMLGELMRFRKGIAIAGTHGKTTTTSLVSAVLTSAGVDPTFIIGGEVHSANTNGRLGKGEFLVAEADESDASFLHLQPQMAIVTNIDRDHMSAYDGDYDRLKQTYLDFLHNLPFYGLAVLCFDDHDVRDIASRLRKPFVTYGLSEDVDYRAIEICQTGSEITFEVIRYEKSIGHYKLALPGQHNVRNALAAIAIGFKLELSQSSILDALSSFQGIRRRFQILGQVSFISHDIELVDDYAHHPTEIKATLQATRDCWPDRRIVVVFQPHRYTRTRDLFDDFSALLAEIPDLIITEVYPGGEEKISGSDGRSLCRAIRKRGNDPVFVESLDELGQILSKMTRQGDIVLTLGAGDIGRFANNLAAACQLARKRTVQ